MEQVMKVPILNHTNITEKVPSKGDVLVITTKKSKDRKIIVMVKDVIKSDYGFEIILNKSTNSYFIWSMYLKGEDWVWRVWNLGDITLTSSTNNTTRLIDL
jgi:hypothetical protein